MSILNELKRRYEIGNIVEKLIYINVGVFIISLLIGVFQGLYNGQANVITQWFALDTDLISVLLKPWTIISYGFLHAGFLHILFNCIALYYIGNLFTQYFTQLFKSCPLNQHNVYRILTTKR